MTRALFGVEKQLQSDVLCNYSKLEFCFLAQKKTKHFVSFLHGSPFLLSVPFEDIFQDDVANRFT